MYINSHRTQCDYGVPTPNVTFYFIYGNHEKRKKKSAKNNFLYNMQLCFNATMLQNICLKKCVVIVTYIDNICLVINKEQRGSCFDNLFFKL